MTELSYLLPAEAPAMLEIFATVLKHLWPFIKESILQGGTVGQWIFKNLITCIWIFLLLTMLCVVLYLGDLVNQSQIQLVTAINENKAIKVQNEKLKAQKGQLSQSLAAEKAKVTQLTSQGFVNQNKVEVYETWLQQCGIKPPMTNSVKPLVCPGGKRKVSAPSHDGPRKPRGQLPKPEKKTFKDRVRSIFGFDPTSSEQK